ncbi:MAG: response regulator [Kofleriaceae bacterium]
MKPYVLIVDDEFGLADVMSDLLVAQGYDVEIAINGQLGLDALLKRPADLVLVDVMMPIMGGPEMVGRMRALPELATIPVIMMSGLPEAIPKGPDAPHDAVLIKPFPMKTLLATVVGMLAKRR